MATTSVDTASPSISVSNACEDKASDSVAQVMQQRLGGAVGIHARKFGCWITAGPWVFLFATVTFLLSLARQKPCIQGSITESVNNYQLMCYSDIPILYQARHLSSGDSPYGFEYPVLINFFIDCTRTLAGWFGVKVSGTTDAAETLSAANVFFGINIVLLFVCFLAAVAFQIKTTSGRPYDAMMVAVAPTVVMSALINWDLLCVVLCSAAVWAWAKNNPVLAGVFIGLGVATKLYPVLLLAALFPLCIRAKKVLQFLMASIAAAVAWAIPNLVVFLMRPQEWKVFWSFNVDRGSDLGSLYYGFSILSRKKTDGLASKVSEVMKLIADNATVMQIILFTAGMILIYMLVFYAPRRPRFGQVAFLVVCLFLIVNKVYSPQYVLWLLPFVILARPKWNTYIIWTITELCYYAAIWGHLGGMLYGPYSHGVDYVYVASIFVRICGQLMLVWLVVKEIIDPRRDIVRRGGADDPAGGVLDGAKGWFASK